MRKKIQSITLHFKMPHLFREDLEEMEEVLKKLSPRVYHIENQNFEYKVVKEIPENLGRMYEFHIQTYSPYINIDLNHFSARLYSGDDEIKTVGAIKKISNIISHRERKILYLSSSLSTWIAPFLMFIPLVLILDLLKEGIRPSLNLIWLLLLLIPIISAIWWIVGYNSSIKNFSIIESSYRKNRESFFIRNKDKIILTIISSALTATATILSTKLIK